MYRSPSENEFLDLVFVIKISLTQSYTLPFLTLTMNAPKA